MRPNVKVIDAAVLVELQMRRRQIGCNGKDVMTGDRWTVTDASFQKYDRQ